MPALIIHPVGSDKVHKFISFSPGDTRRGRTRLPSLHVGSWACLIRGTSGITLTDAYRASEAARSVFTGVTRRSGQLLDRHLKTSGQHIVNIDRMIAVGAEIRATGTWSNTVQVPDVSTRDFEGHFTSILVPEDGMNAYDQSRFYALNTGAKAPSDSTADRFIQVLLDF